MKKLFWLFALAFLVLTIQQASSLRSIDKTTEISQIQCTSVLAGRTCNSLVNSIYESIVGGLQWVGDTGIEPVNITVNFTSNVKLKYLNLSGMDIRFPTNLTILDGRTNNVLYTGNLTNYYPGTGSWGVLLNITNLVSTDSIVLIYNRSFAVANPTKYTNDEFDFLVQTAGGARTASLDYPTPGSSFIRLQNITFNSTSSSDETYNVTNATLYIWNATGIYNISSTTFGGQSQLNTSSFLIGNIPPGDGYLWNVYTCGSNLTASNCSFASSNSTFNINSFALIAQSYDNSVYETDNRTFTANITLDTATTFIAASFVYNGTAYPLSNSEISSSGINYYFKKIVDIESTQVNTTKNFYWRFTFRNGVFNTQSTIPNIQNVSATNITNRVTTIPAVNYTLYDEETLQPINASFASTFNWYIGSGSVVENYSYILPSTNIFKFYSVPGEDNIITSQKIAITNGSQGTQPTTNASYTNRYFDFNKDIFSSTTTEKNLYLLPFNNGTDVVIRVADNGFAPLSNIIVKIERYYQGDNKYRMVENKRTDSYGSINARLVTSNTKYRFTFYDSNNNQLKQVVDDYIICQSTTCILPFVITDNNLGLNYYNQSTPLVQSNLTFNNNSNTFSLTWNDNTNDNARYRLQVTEFLFNGSFVVYNQSSTATSGILSYSAGTFKATYEAQAFRLKASDTKEILYMDTLSAKIGDLSRVFGMEGLMWSAILMLTMITVGIYSPVVGVTLYMVVAILLGVLDIIYINPAIMVAEIVLGVLFIWAFRS